MRTSIFNKFADLEKEFSEDIKILWNLPEEQRVALIPKVDLLFKSRTSGDMKKIMDQAVSEIDGKTVELLRCLKLLHFIFREWNPISDTPDDFIKDLNELNLLPDKGIENAEGFLLDFFLQVQRDNDRRLQKLYANSILPSYIGCTTLVDFRAIIRNPYGSGLDDEVPSYKPSCAGFTPVIIAQIRTNSGNSSDLKFQLEEEDVQHLIDILTAALKDLDSAKKSLPGGTE